MIPKFRAWIKQYKKMDNDIGEMYFEDGEFKYIGDDVHYKRLPEHVILMLSTEIKDRNSVEIFEGDVLEIQGIKMIVKFGSYKYLETSKNNGHILGVLYDGLGFYVECINAADPDNISPFEPETLKNSQIIGNIYENKELLDA
ncbi:YopX family protein [Streptococcus sp. OH4692_COT-348]|uniref:YopX family protein n=1 Tax=Streptococcus sp. OH4692_COT-348 TaxID=2491052 RepID=UPI000F5F42AF|nr:YopX family protein [Streptococcus sp. OH4692_COT-348]RRD33242.1 hypothetical protein EII37_07340 [Streptococcus sp. OH4692_COT-348]